MKKQISELTSMRAKNLITDKEYLEQKQKLQEERKKLTNGKNKKKQHNKESAEEATKQNTKNKENEEFTKEDIKYIVGIVVGLIILLLIFATLSNF